MKRIRLPLKLQTPILLHFAERYGRRKGQEIPLRRKQTLDVISVNEKS
jgi:hypothetical protein